MLSTQRKAQKEDVDGESVSMWFKVMQKKYPDGAAEIVINHCKSLPASHFKFMTSRKKKCWNNNFPICAVIIKMGGIENWSSYGNYKFL